MKKVLLTAAFVSVFLPAISWGEYAPCPDGASPLTEDHRAYALLKPMQTIIGAHDVAVCVLENPERSYIQVAFSGIWVISATTFVLDTFSEDALKGALAHELGHILLRKSGQVPAPSSEREDREADAIAIKLVGEQALLSTYIAHTGDAALSKRRVGRALLIVSKNDWAFPD